MVEIEIGSRSRGYRPQRLNQFFCLSCSFLSVFAVKIGLICEISSLCSCLSCTVILGLAVCVVDRRGKVLYVF